VNAKAPGLLVFPASRWIALSAALLLAACATTPEPRFYTLAPQAVVERAAPAVHLPYAVVVLEPASLSELVDRPQWVVRRSNSEVSILEQQRWAVPLRTEIPRVVAENLSSLLATEVVAESTRVPLDAYRVSLEVAGFEMLPTEEVGVDVEWHIRKGNHEVASGRSQVREGVAGSDFEAAASAYSRALGGVSRDIAEGIRGLREGGR
jgi:uncharacterized protein